MPSKVTADAAFGDAILVAHRGDAARHPENSLAAFASAAKLGIRHVELDVQLTHDGVPIVLHDASLARTHGLNVNVTTTSVPELAALGVLTGGNRPPPVPRLAEFAAWMRKTPQMHVFVEIKKESLHAHGRKRVLAAVVQAIEKIRARATIISYDARVLAMAKREAYPIGYVLPGMSRRYQAVAERLAPQFLFADYRQILHAGTLWPGDRDWAAFDLEDLATTKKVARLGVRYLETMNPVLFKLI
ncbi:MAG: glycerophosphodiester phosphodiesterase family protein [Gammaproteobacteria bacterium]